MTKVGIGIDGEPLVADGRLEKVFSTLGRLIQFPEGLEFATMRQEPTEVDGKVQSALALFYVISPHPKQSKRIISPHKIISLASMQFTSWVEANKEYRHYAGLADPLRPIFAGLLRQHMTKREDLEALVDN